MCQRRFRKCFAPFGECLTYNNVNNLTTSGHRCGFAMMQRYRGALKMNVSCRKEVFLSSKVKIKLQITLVLANSEI